MSSREHVATYRTGLLLSVIRVTKATAQTTFKYDPVIYDILYFGDRRNILLLFSGLKVKLKVKYTLVQALRLRTGRIDHRGSRGIAVLYRH